MVVRREEMHIESREKMRGGEGTIQITHYAEAKNYPHTRLICEIIIPVAGSIGEHCHEQEVEFYIIHEGEGMVRDDGVDKKVVAGDVVITGNGASHHIWNTGKSPLKMSAVIVTEKV